MTTTNTAEKLPKFDPVWADLDNLFNDQSNDATPLKDIFDAMVERQVKEGHDLKKPCPEAKELLDQWQIDDGGYDYLPQWSAAVARQNPGVSAVEEAAPDQLNDAVVLGPDTPEWQALLQREMTFLLPKYPAGDIKQKVWNNTTARLEEWLTDNAAGSLTRHVVRSKKGFMPITFGASAGNRRTTAAMTSAECLALDVESGDSRAAAEKRAEELGLAVITYTSFNDQTTNSLLKRDAVLQALKIETDPTDEQVRAYLTELGQHRPEHIATVRIKDQHLHTEDGVKIELKHAPLEKWRMVFPLAKAQKVTDLGPFQKVQQAVFASKIRGLAQMMGVLHDESCEDVSRAFYAPSHRPDADCYVAVHRGRGLTFDEVPTLEGKRTSNGQGGKMKGWAKETAPFFEIAALLDAECPDKVREDKGGLLVVECPFDHLHGNAGDVSDGACHVRDADGDTGFVWDCKHNSCKDHDRLDMLAQALNDGWFERDLIEAGSPYVIQPDEEEPEAKKEAEKTDETGSEFEDPKVWLPKRYKISNGTIWVKGEDEESDAPICAAFNVVGRSSNEDGTAGAGRIISFKNENGKVVERTISRADIVADGNAVLRDLADRGLQTYGRGKKATDRLLDLLNEITPQRQIPTVTTPGWVRDEHGDIAGFMHPTGVYDRVSGPPCRLLEGSRVEVVKTKGTLQNWSAAAVEALSHADTKFYWPLGLVSSFAGPLLGILEWLPCGFSLSGMTSKGKTMALTMGTTVWTSPVAGHGLLFTANTTGNAMEDLATRGTDSFLGVDELGAMADKRQLGGIVFSFSTGRTKSRKSGRGRGLTEGDSFRPFAVFSSESGMRNEIMAAGGDYRGGLAVRIPEIDVSSGVDVSEAAVARLDAFRSNYGHAGPIFIRHLITTGVITDAAKLEREVIAIATELAHGRGAAMSRAARVFALAQRGGELAADANLLGEPSSAKMSIRKSIQTAWDTFTQSDEAGAATGGEALLDDLRSFLFGELNRSIVVLGEQVDVSDDHAYARGKVLGWADADVIYLDSAKVHDPKALGLDIGSRNEMLKQLSALEVLLLPDGKGNTFRQLPKELSEGREDGAAVRNIRLCRKTLGI